MPALLNCNLIQTKFKLDSYDIFSAGNCMEQYDAYISFRGYYCIDLIEFLSLLIFFVLEWVY